MVGSVEPVASSAVPTEAPSSTSVTSVTSIVILGATGDLTKRLLFPAIHRLMSTGRVSASTRLIGFAMEDWTTEQFLANLHDGVSSYGDGVDETVWAQISSTATYVKGELDGAHVGALTSLITGPAVFYLALPPPLFGTAATALGEVGLADETSGWRRLVIEKPFGTSLDTAAALQTQLRTHWQEQQLFRIDHFLGKDTVQNMLVFRLANRFVEAIWNSANIAQVQVTAAETLGLEGRWRYYDKAGALRDMIQNHLMQLFALCAMEPPAVWDGEVLRDHKVELLRAVRSIVPDDVVTSAIRGQYGEGTINNSSVVAYRAEENIAPTSTTETYAAVKLFVDNWRWQGVPFVLRSGKHLAGGVTEIALELRDPPLRLFTTAAMEVSEPTWIVLRLRPDETIEIDAIAKKAGLGLETERIVLSATDTSVGGADYSAYEQLILDVILGDPSHFIRGDEAQEAWRIVQPVLDAWAGGGEPLSYAAGTDGPTPPDGFFDHQRSWRALRQ